MRISDWSSDVCSSDLGGRNQEGFAELSLRRRALCIDLTIADAAVLHFAIFAKDGVDVEGFKFRHFEPFRLSRGVCGAIDTIALCAPPIDQIGRASCRERVCQSV